MESFKLLSWNILSPNALDIASFQNRYMQIKNWKYRFRLLLLKIIAFNPDIICLQEIDAKNKNEFIEGLQEHGFCESSYANRGETGGVLVLHKVSKFKLFYKNNIQLTVEGISKDPGVAAWATLIYEQTQQKILITSLHLDWRLAKEQLIKLILALKASGSISMIIAGDFNISYKTILETIIPTLNLLNTLEDKDYFSLFEHSSWTAQPPHNPDPTSWQSLDHVVFSNNLKFDLTASFVSDNQNTYQDNNVKKKEFTIQNNSEKFIPSDICPSDHLPIIITFYLK